MTLRLTTIGMLAAVALATAAPAFAQLPPARAARPARTVFGAGMNRPASDRLTIGGFFAGGYDDDLSVPPPGAVPLRSGQFGSVGTNLTYTMDRDSVRSTLTFGAYGRYYSNSSGPVLGTWNGGGQFDKAFTKKTSMSGSASVGSYLGGAAIFGGDAYLKDPYSSSVPFVPIDNAAFVNGTTYDSFFANAQITHKVNERVDMGGSYAYYGNNSWTPATDTTASVHSIYGAQTASGSVTYSIGKGFGLRGGYSYTGAGFAASSDTRPAFRGQSFDGGLTYSQALSVTRRSSLSFSTSMSTVTDQNLNSRFFAGGMANFQYEIGRSWDFGVNFDRSVNFYQMLAQPTFYDRLGAQISGGIGRRVQVSGGVGVERGTIGITTSAPAYNSENAGVGVRFGLTRYIALSVNYAYYNYRFDSAAALPPGLMSSMERQVFRVSLDVWAPLFERARRPNATR